MALDPLDALSPIDGRYARSTLPLREHLSEAALIRERVRIEAEWLLALAKYRPAGLKVAASVPQAVLAAARDLVGPEARIEMRRAEPPRKRSPHETLAPHRLELRVPVAAGESGSVVPHLQRLAPARVRDLFVTLHALASQLVPRSEAPARASVWLMGLAIAPIALATLERQMSQHAALDDLQIGKSEKIVSGFYISQAVEARRR